MSWLFKTFKGNDLTRALRSYWCHILHGDRLALWRASAGCCVMYSEEGEDVERELRQWPQRLLPSTPIPEPEWAKWDIERYRTSVWSVTRKQPIHELPGFSLRGKGWELDHFISIKQGHKLGHSPEFIGGIKNLRMVCLTQNRAKSGRAMYREHSDAEDSLHQ
jgi:hypothetical protein